jgi:hypothetical protein
VHADDNANPVVYDLAAGDHTLWICYREDGALLDKVVITNTGITPTGAGDIAEGCVIVDRTTELWYEAECALVGESWEKAEATDASNQAYAGTPFGMEYLDVPAGNAAEVISFPFTVSEATEYQVWARVITPSDEANSFWVKMDDSEWALWEDIPVGSDWHWDDVHDTNPAEAVSYELTAGEHTLTVCQREDGTLLDKILITNTGLTPEGYGGTAEACSIVGLDRVSGEEGLRIYPNPSTGSFRVESGHEFSRFEVLSLDGKILMSRGFGKPRLSEQVKLQLDAGLYLLRVSNGENSMFRRLVIQ